MYNIHSCFDSNFKYHTFKLFDTIIYLNNQDKIKRIFFSFENIRIIRVEEFLKYLHNS